MRTLRLLRALSFLFLVLFAARPAAASSISVLVGDKDGFGGVLTSNGTLANCAPNTNCLSPVQDWRDAAEKLATNGSQLTDVYSALYTGSESDCFDASGLKVDCSPNGPTGSVLFSFSGLLTSATITMLMGDFESTQNGAMSAYINGIPINFSYNHGYTQTGLESIVLTQAMLDAANATGQVVLYLDHTSAFYGLNDPRNFGSFDYVAFDYFELNGTTIAAPVPEPGTWLLLGTGLTILARRAIRPKTNRSKKPSP